MRLFVALELSPEVRETIAALIRKLRPLDESWKWTRAENLHVTLKFLGETAAENLDGILHSLRNVTFEQALVLNFRGLGFFPNDPRPRVLWIGIDGSSDLATLAKGVGDALAKVGVPNEERVFTPHLTLARSKEGSISSELREALARYSGQEFGRVVAPEFRLIRSELKSTGAEYTTLASFPCCSNAE